MQGSRKAMTPRERELVKRCIILALGSVFFFMLAAVRAMSMDYYDGYNNNSDYDYYREEDRYGMRSADDDAYSQRLRRRMVGNRPVYHRRKAGRVHDSVTIVIDETTSSEITSSNDLKRNTSNDTTLTNWLTPSFSGGLGTKQHGQAAGGNTPTISWSGSRAHKSDSTIERTQSFESTLTGKVIDVKPNGYLQIEARKSVNVNGEIQTVTLTGIVNPDHMDSNSAINAEYIMDVAITYTGNGPMTRMDKRGWGAKIIDFLNPF